MASHGLTGAEQIVGAVYNQVLFEGRGFCVNRMMAVWHAKFGLQFPPAQTFGEGYRGLGTNG